MSTPTDFDYKALLKKYIRHVSIQEGISFIEDWEEYEREYAEAGITKEEAAELLRLLNA